MGYEFITESRIGIIVYDVSIKDLEERKKNVIKFGTLKLASQRLGIEWKALKNSIETRSRIYAPFLNKEVAIRYDKPNN